MIMRTAESSSGFIGDWKTTEAGSLWDAELIKRLMLIYSPWNCLDENHELEAPSRLVLEKIRPEAIDEVLGSGRGQSDAREEELVETLVGRSFWNILVLNHAAVWDFIIEHSHELGTRRTSFDSNKLSNFVEYLISEEKFGDPKAVT